MQIAVIINGHGGYLKKAYSNDPKLGYRLEKKIEKSGLNGIVYEPFIEDMSSLFTHLKRNKGDSKLLICSWGGDATLLYVTSYAINYFKDCLDDIYFHALKGGSTNTGIKASSGYCNPIESIDYIIENLSNKRSLHHNDINTILVPSKHLNLPIDEFTSRLCGQGAEANIIEEYESGFMEKGLPKVAYIASRAIPSALIKGDYAKRLGKPMISTIYVDGEKVVDSERMTAVVINSIENLFPFFKPFYGVDKGMHLIATSWDTKRIIKNILKVKAQTRIKEEGWYDFPNSQEVRLITHEEDNPKIVIDGNIFAIPPDTTLKLGPKTKMIASPNKGGKILNWTAIC